MLSKRNFAFLAVFLVQMFYAATFTFANDIIDSGKIKPFGFILMRVILATILFWVFSIFAPKEKIDKKDFRIFFLAAVFGVAINMLLFFKGLEFTTPIHAAVLMVVAPILVLILSAIYLNEKLTKLKILGVLLGFAGVVLLSLYGKSAVASDNVLLGNILVLINAASYSVYIIIVKKLIVKYHPFTFIKWLFLFGCILIFPFGIQELLEVNWDTFEPYTCFSLVWIIIGATFGTYLLNLFALRELKASTVSSFIYLQPVLAGMFALFMGSDQLDVVKILATILIFTGVYLVSVRSKDKITGVITKGLNEE